MKTERQQTAQAFIKQVCAFASLHGKPKVSLDGCRIICEYTTRDGVERGEIVMTTKAQAAAYAFRINEALNKMSWTTN